jgi:hypothetical protein
MAHGSETSSFFKSAFLVASFERCRFAMIDFLFRRCARVAFKNKEVIEKKAPLICPSRESFLYGMCLSPAGVPFSHSPPSCTAHKVVGL